MPIPLSVLFVCTGNICRSPSAHAVLHAMVKDRLGGHITVDSAATHRYHIGELPDPRARIEGRRRGYILDHRARHVVDDDFDRFDLIVAMDNGHVGELLRRAGRHRRTDHVSLLRRWDPSLADPTAIPGVLDPYDGDEKDFADMFDVIERSCDQLCTDLGRRLADGS